MSSAVARGTLIGSDRPKRDRIRALTAGRPIAPTSNRCLSARQPNRGRGSNGACPMDMCWVRKPEAPFFSAACATARAISIRRNAGDLKVFWQGPSLVRWRANHDACLQAADDRGDLSAIRGHRRIGLFCWRFRRAGRDHGGVESLRERLGVTSSPWSVGRPQRGKLVAKDSIAVLLSIIVANMSHPKNI
jgi:hypothetical protein